MMENPIVKAKRELMEWIRDMNDLEEIDQLLKLKNNKTSNVVAEAQAEYHIKDDFDERFARGMTGEELMTKVRAHIESLSWKKR